MTKKIIIFGFPHCGTSILKSIIAHSDNVEEIYDEMDIINKETTKDFIICKWPYTRASFFEEEYKDYIKIFILRNPLFVFSSLNKRFKYNIPNNHKIDEYIKSIKLFTKHRNNTNNIYTIKYEDLFTNNYKELRSILNNIGIKYTDDIFDNTKYTNVHLKRVELVKEKPKNVEHEKYRTWQINQQFVSNNDVSKLDLLPIQKQILIHNSDILKVYPHIKKTVKQQKTLTLPK